MDDNRTNLSGNQSPDVPKPIYETVPVDISSSQQGEEMKPEEISPEVQTPETINTTMQPEIAPIDQPPVFQENKMKYILAGVGGIVFIIIMIVIFSVLNKARSGTSGQKKKDITLVYWGLHEEKEIMDPLIKEYQAKNPGVQITYEKKPLSEYREKLIARTKNGQGPDIFRFHNTWLPEIRDVASILPDTIMSNAAFEKTFYPIHQKDLKIGKSYYGIPLMIDGLMLIYNEDIFKKAGISTPPGNWDELVETAGKVQVQGKDGNLLTAGIAMGTASNVEHFPEIFGLMLLLNGGDVTKLDANEAAGALEAYRRFAEPPNYTWQEMMPNSITAFAQEKVAMIIAPSWEIHSIKSANPEIKLKTVPIPKLPGGKQVSVSTYWVEGVSEASKNKEEAWKFLVFLSEKESMTKLYKNAAATRLFGEPYSRVDLASTLSQNEYLAPIIKQAADDLYVSLPLCSRTFDNGLNDGANRYIENAINGTIKGVSYSEALKTAKQGIDEIFLRYNIK